MNICRIKARHWADLVIQNQWKLRAAENHLLDPLPDHQIFDDLNETTSGLFLHHPKFEFGGDLVLDTAQLTLTGPSSTVTLSRRECDLLAAFCRAPGLLRARAVLLGSVWGSAAEIEDCSLDSYIRFIRRRLTAVGSRAVLRTVRGAGYRFLPDGEENAHA